MTNRTEERLLQCFSAVFPDESPETICCANRDSMSQWDSLASVTLLGLIQQEFAVDIDLFDLENLNSFQLLLGYVQSHQSATNVDPL